MRYNIFNKAHLPIRTALLQGCITLTNKIEEKGLDPLLVLKRVEEVLNIYHEQVMFETLHVLPLIFEYEPSVWNTYTAEHNSLSKFAQELENLLQSYHRLQKQNDKSIMLKRLGDKYDEFVLSNYNHMDDEEAVLNEILWRYYPNEVLIQINEKMDILPHLVARYAEKSRYQIAAAA